MFKENEIEDKYLYKTCNLISRGERRVFNLYQKVDSSLIQVDTYTKLT